MFMGRKLIYKDVSFPHGPTDTHGFNAIRKEFFNIYFSGFVGLFRVS